MTPERVLSWDEFQEHVQTLKVIPKYDAASEEKTPHPWWNLDKEKIHQILKHISDLVNSSTNGAIDLDRELQHVIKTATSLEKVDRAPPVKVALIGAQGAGKSLLINALFDCKGLSLTGANGACTSAIIKYAFDTGEKYSAEVQFLNARMREEMVDEHIKSYVHYHNDLDDTDDEDGPRVRSLKQDKIEEKLKKTAEDFFDTIFGSRDAFLTAWSSSPVNTGEFKSLCQLKCTEAMENSDVDSKHIAHFSKNSPEELLKEIRPFISTVTNGSCLWPIVNYVTIRHRHRLLQGLEIIDLPGSGDVNMLRARHADEIKDNVDVEIILGDTIRITTDDTVISTARSGVLNHGASKVKILATKIDAISDNQLTQCTGALYDEIKVLMQQAEVDATTAEEEGEDAKATQIGRYKQYLERCLKSRMIKERAGDISNKFSTLLQGRSKDDDVEVIHTSTADYMLWIKNAKILFKDQPALQPEETGVPAVRRFLYNLQAPQSLQDYQLHINTTLPAFVDKLKRVITQSDRDAGFRTIADDFDDLRSRFIGDLFKQIKWHYLSYSKNSISKIRKDESAYKAQIQNRLEKKWTVLKSPAFTRIVKSRGNVPRGVSRAKGLENGVNWNRELADILAPGLRKWYAAHTEYLRQLRSALDLNSVRLYHDTVAIMNSSAANLVTVEKAKLRWKPFKHRMQSKLKAMIDEMEMEEKRILHRSTFEDEREINIITSITDDIYDDVHESTPGTKITARGKERYITPKLKFQKARLEKHFLDPQSHFVDKFIAAFQKQLEDKMYALVNKHFDKIKAMFDEFSAKLRDHAPVDYAINPMGEAIRESLEKHIPEIETKALELQNILGKPIKTEDEELGNTEDNAEEPDGQVQDLSYYLDKVKKRKHTTTTDSRAKRIKYEE